MCLKWLSITTIFNEATKTLTTSNHKIYHEYWGRVHGAQKEIICYLKISGHAVNKSNTKQIGYVAYKGRSVSH